MRIPVKRRVGAVVQGIFFLLFVLAGCKDKDIVIGSLPNGSDSDSDSDSGSGALDSATGTATTPTSGDTGTNDMCTPAGDVCAVTDACCSGLCRVDSDGISRCPVAGQCQSEGEACTDNADCCNYQCTEAGTCLEQKACDVAGEACSKSKDCCSGACADDGSGVSTCLFLGGCRPFGELCRSDAECCNHPANGGPGVCEMINNDVGRCGNPPGCAPAGELCGLEYHECCPCDIPQNSPGCPNGDQVAQSFCQETLFGVSRCFSDVCVFEGGNCQTDGDCCGGTCTAGVCGDGIQCRDNLSSCAFSDQCCCNLCAPNASGAFVCCPGDIACIDNGDQCTTDRDCCSGNCTFGFCGAVTNDCVPFGGACTTPEDCCTGFCHTDQTTGAGSCISALVE